MNAGDPEERRFGHPPLLHRVIPPELELYEDVPLPEGSRVLGGGRFLYLLLDEHSPPWRIAKLRLLGER